MKKKSTEWLNKNTLKNTEFKNISKLIDLKKKKKLKISLGLPTLNEEKTIAKEIVILKGELMENYPLLDEIAVIDSGSDDNTCQIAQQFGAKTYLSKDILPNHKSVRGKGENLWKSLMVLKGDIIVWVDADIHNIHPRFVYGLVGPLLKYDNLGFVKAFYDRPISWGTEKSKSGGGRVTELLVRPFFNMFFPELAGIIQPLAGEYAGRRNILEKIPFYVGYGVETGMLIDICSKFGIDIIAQVDLEQRIHRNQSTQSLGRMAFGIMQIIINKLSQYDKIDVKTKPQNILKQFIYDNEKYLFNEYIIKETERPPICTLNEYKNKYLNQDN